MGFTEQLPETLTLEGCYRALQRTGGLGSAEAHLLGRRHWLHDASDFDERTGDMLPVALSELCARLPLEFDARPAIKDRLYRIVEHVHLPLHEILRNLHERLVREHATLPLRSVRELDTASFYALSRRPGRTIREKLATRPYLWAVQRRWTVDTSENRLVKAFCLRLAQILRARANCSGLQNETLIDDVHATVEAWLQGEAAKEIGRWDNLPPNNFLLQHRDYRRVWDAWRWLEAIDDDLARDQQARLSQWMTIVFWSLAARLASCECVRLLEQPCYPHYERFSIASGTAREPQKAVLDGLFIPPVSHRDCGVVTKLGTDRRGEGYGFASLQRGGSAFFHSNMFASEAAFDAVKVGTLLVFDLVEPPDGRLRAERPELLPAPAPIHAVLEHDSRILLRAPDREAVEISCFLDGNGVRISVGRRSTAADLSPQAAVHIADSIASSLFGVPSQVKSGNEQPGPAAASSPTGPAVVDLCALRPRYATQTEDGILPFRLLWQRWCPDGREPVELDLGSAEAIALRGNAASVSVLDLLSTDSALPPAVLSQAARCFAARIREAIHTETLTYIVPDSTDEFALSTLRRSVNAAFRAAEPLPRSIGAVFAWQSSDRFARYRVADGDCVLVLDTVGSTVSATPLLARSNDELAQRVPESAGVYWERLPCSRTRAPASSVRIAASVLDSIGAGMSDSVASLCGLTGLVDEGRDLSWQDDSGSWHTLPFNLAPSIEEAIDRTPNPWVDMAHALDRELKRLKRDARVFILPVGDVFRRRVPPLRLPTGREAARLDPVKPHQGGAVLQRWQEMAGDVPFWRDHLPELSMRVIKGGRQERFYLVKDVTVAPKRGRAVSIPISDSFVLPAGLTDYQFPLLQGSDESELRYVAFLKSPAFPLQADVPVHLRLTYSYGTDTPYDLVFTPTVESVGGMSSVRVEWRPRSQSEAHLPAHFPAMPALEPWARFERYPRRGSDETSDLLEWIRSNLEHTHERFSALHAPRQSGTVSADWRPDVRGSLYTFVTCDLGRVFCHESEFLDASEVSNLGVGDVVSLDVERGSRGLRGKLIGVGPGPRQSDHVFALRCEDLVRRMRKGLRFPFLTVWSGGHSLSEPEVPPTFRDAMLAGTETLIAILSQDPPEGASERYARAVHDLSDEALFLLSCMHCDAPGEISNRLQGAIAGRGNTFRALTHYYRHLAMALGGADLEWQRELLDSVIGFLRSERPHLGVCSAVLRILSVAIWRNERLLDALDAPDLRAVADQSIAVLRQDLDSLTNRQSPIDPAVLKDHLELVLGLLRIRGSGDADIRMLLAPGRGAASSLAGTVERIVDVVVADRIPLRSRLTLQVDKPSALDKMPDLLFALKLYLTGDAGSRAIRVMEVREDDDCD